MSDDSGAATNGDERLDEAASHLAAGDMAAAERTLRQLLQDEPGNHDALYNLSISLLGQGRARDALQAIRPCVDAAPINPQYLRALATAQAQANQSRRAMRTLERLLEIAPDDVDGHYLLAVQHRLRNDYDAAMGHLGAVLERQPEHLGALFDSGALFAHMGRLDEARSAFAHAVQAAPDNADAWANLGNVQLLRHDFEEALQAFEKALAFNEGNVEAMRGVVLALRRGGQPVASAERARGFLRERPREPRLLDLLGTALRESGQFDAARQAYDQAIAVDPAKSTPRLNRAMVDLFEGDWAAGWDGYELRWQQPGYRSARRGFAQPRWDGGPLAGKTLLLYAEQGLGDTIQFTGLAATLAERFGGRVVLECQPELVSLLQTAPGIERVIARGETLPAFDLQLPLMSLPATLNLTPEQVESPAPYLTAGACPAAVAAALSQVEGRCVGLMWRGNPGFIDDWKRKLPFSALAPLFELAGVTVVSLQHGRNAATEPLPGGAIDAMAHVESFADTAGVIARLDDLVACDSAVAHLAGALAAPCRVLLPYVPDWRWGPAGETTPWYPGMRLYRQPALHDWQTVIAAVTADLADAG